MDTFHDGPLEKNCLDLGFVPLSDCAPLVAAYEKGFFEAEGLAVTLHRERSWASIRDKTAFGVFDAAQMLYPMPLASTMGVGTPAVPMLTACCLSLGGNAITVSPALHEQMREAVGSESIAEVDSAAAVAEVVRHRREAGKPPLTFGCVFPTSTHHYELRQWLGSAGIDSDLDLRLIVVSPPDMPAALQDGVLDGFCVGEPWNTVAVQRGWGRIVITKHTLWNHGPEKVLGVTRAWAEHHPHTHQALLRAILAAGAWCDDKDNHEELCGLIAVPRYVDVPLQAIEPSIHGRVAFDQRAQPTQVPGFMTFHNYAANFPWVSHGLRFMDRMVEAGQIDAPDDALAVAAAVLRPDLYRRAAAAIGWSAPLIDHKPEDVHDHPWPLTTATDGPITMGPDRMLPPRHRRPAPQRPSGASAPR